MVDRDNPVPMYLQVANWIESMLQASEYEVGSKLPSEGELAEKISAKQKHNQTCNICNGSAGTT